MRNNSVFQSVKEMLRGDSDLRAAVQGFGIATMLAGILMFTLGANTYVQSYKQTDWVFGSAYITDISETIIKGSLRNRQGGINYSMAYEYEVNGTYYTGAYGPLANPIAVGNSIRIKYDPNAPENSTGFLEPSGNDLALVIIGTVFAVAGFFMSGIPSLLRSFLRKLPRKEIPDYAPPEEKRRLSPKKAPAHSAGEIVMGIRNALRTLAPILIFLLFGLGLMLIQNAKH